MDSTSTTQSYQILRGLAILCEAIPMQQERVLKNTSPAAEASKVRARHRASHSDAA